ncbi:MAG: hypothetical protein VYA30_11030 [Myxococcota bacterium]|nr:hypothetical protein [Myxococcota bacterium]
MLQDETSTEIEKRFESTDELFSMESADFEKLRYRIEQPMITCINEPDGILLYWTLTSASITRGQSRQSEGSEARLTLRIYIETAQGAKRTQDFKIDRWIGFKRVDLPKTVSRVVGAIGIRTPSGFSHIVRSTPIQRPLKSHGRESIKLNSIDWSTGKTDVLDVSSKEGHSLVRAYAQSLSGPYHAHWLPKLTSKSARLESAQSVQLKQSAAIGAVLRLQLEFDQINHQKAVIDYVVDVCLPVIATLRDIAIAGEGSCFGLAICPRLISFLNSQENKQSVVDELQARRFAMSQVVHEHPEIFSADQDRLNSLQTVFDIIDKDILEELRRLHELGCIELMTTWATNAPLTDILPFRGSVELNLATALKTFRSAFGFESSGLYLGQQGYMPSFDALFHKAGIRYFIVTSDAFSAASAKPAYGVLTPMSSPNSQTVALAIDPKFEAWKQMGDDRPDGDYRLSKTESLLHSVDPVWGGSKRSDGSAYCHVSGEKAAQTHARAWWTTQSERLDKCSRHTDHQLCLIGAIDAESMTKNWYEGMSFLRELSRISHADKSLKLMGISRHLDSVKRVQVARLSPVISADRSPHLLPYLAPRIELAAWQVKSLIEAHGNHEGLTDRLVLVTNALLSAQDALSSESTSSADCIRQCTQFIHDIYTAVVDQEESTCEPLKSDPISRYLHCIDDVSFETMLIQ